MGLGRDHRACSRSRRMGWGRDRLGLAMCRAATGRAAATKKGKGGTMQQAAPTCIRGADGNAALRAPLLLLSVQSAASARLAGSARASATTCGAAAAAPHAQKAADHASATCNVVQQRMGSPAGGTSRGHQPGAPAGGHQRGAPAGGHQPSGYYVMTHHPPPLGTLGPPAWC